MPQAKNQNKKGQQLTIPHITPHYTPQSKNLPRVSKGADANRPGTETKNTSSPPFFTPQVPIPQLSSHTETKNNSVAPTNAAKNSTPERNNQKSSLRIELVCYKLCLLAFRLKH